MLKSETKEIGGKKYSVTQLSAEPGQRLFFHLVKFVGPGVSTLLREWQGTVTDEGKPQVDAETIAAALSELVQVFTYAHFRDFVDTFMSSTHVIGSDKEGNEVRVPLEKTKALAFAGDYGSLVKWLAFCLEVNFGSFFDDMGLTSPQSPQDSQ